jgi:inosine-uridine nucleoside N-ribohydrolase
MQVTHTVLATSSVCDQISNLGTHFSAQVLKLLSFFESTYRSVFGFEHPPVHDPVAVAFVAAPHIFACQIMRVDIETASPICSGQTVCDVWGTSSLEKNARVARSVNVDAVWSLILEAISTCNDVSPLNAPSGR